MTMGGASAKAEIPKLALNAKLNRMILNDPHSSPDALRQAASEYRDTTASLAALLAGAPVQPTTAVGIVYFIQVGDFIKIGFTGSLAGRLAQFSTASPVVPQLLHQEPGRVEDERAYHRRFAAQHHRLEWFRNEGALADYIAGLSRD